MIETRAKDAAAKPSRRSGDGGMDRAAKIKIGASIAVLLIAAVMIANTFEWIDLWGGTPPPPEEPQLTPEEAQVRRAEQQRIDEQLQRDAERPGTITAGD